MADLYETIKKTDDLKTLSKAIDTAGLKGRLTGKGPFTVFAPNEDAFEKLPSGRREDLLKNETELKKVINNHIVEGKMRQSRLLDEGQVKTRQGNRLTVEEDGGVHVGKARIVQRNIDADNGICHVIDTVLMP